MKFFRLVQPNTEISPDERMPVILKTYSADSAGMIQAFQERFRDTQFEKEIFDLASRDREHFLL